MEVNQEKLDYLVTLSDSIEQSPPSTTIKDENKENRLSLEGDEQRSDQSLVDMIKSRPKRINRKVPSRLRSTNDQTNAGCDDPKPNESTRSVENSSLDAGLDTFFESSSSVLKRRTFADVYPKEEVPRPSSESVQSSIDSNDRNNNQETNNNLDKDSKLCPLSIADRIARSRSSPNLIDPKKMLLPGDPRHNLSMIKELRSRQKSGESTEPPNNRDHHSSLLTELKAKNSPFRSLKDAPSSVQRDKPPISHLKPSLKPSSSGSSLSPSVQQSGHFFNVKLRDTKSNKMNHLTKSHTRASFPVASGNDSDGMKRNSEPNCYQDNGKGEDAKDSGYGEDDVKPSKEGSALNADEREGQSDGSNREPSAREDEKELEARRDNGMEPLAKSLVDRT